MFWNGGAIGFIDPEKTLDFYQVKSKNRYISSTALNNEKVSENTAIAYQMLSIFPI